jgi:hypothetical protein
LQLFSLAERDRLVRGLASSTPAARLVVVVVVATVVVVGTQTPPEITATLALPRSSSEPDSESVSTTRLSRRRRL